MAPGRNDACPCGSGKKYKKCCLEKDEAKQRQARQPTPPEVPAQPHAPVDPEAARVSAMVKEIYARFHAADLEGKVRICRESMDNPEFWCDESTTSMLEPIHRELGLDGRLAEFEPLVNRVREKWPDVYEQAEHWLVLWMAEDALVLGNPNKLQVHVLRMADLAERHIDIADRLISQLRWHGELDLLVELRKRAWPSIRESTRLMPHAIVQFRQDGADEIIFHALERGQSIADTSEVMKQVRELLGEEPGPYHAAWRATLSGVNTHPWTLQDLQLPAVPQHPEGDGPEVDETPAFDNVRDLLDQFRRYLRVKAGLPWTRADMMATEVGSYLLHRAKGLLGSRFSMMDRMFKQHQRAKPFPPPRHVLCPDENTLNVFGGRYFHMLGVQPYHAVAFLGGLPLWTDFLRQRGLVDEQQHTAAMESLTPARHNMAKALRNVTDPQLREAMRGWDA